MFIYNENASHNEENIQYEVVSYYEYGKYFFQNCIVEFDGVDFEEDRFLAEFHDAILSKSYFQKKHFDFDEVIIQQYM